MVKIKLMPVAIGTTTEKFPLPNALNITKAERKINKNAPATLKSNKKLNQLLKSLKTCCFNRLLIMAAPLTFNKA